MLRPLLAVLALTSFACMTQYVCAQSPERLGRLFFEPRERDKLDQMRKAGGLAGGPDADLSLQQPVAGTVMQSTEPEQITLDGYVRRSGGHSTTWINQNPYTESDRNTLLIVRQSQNRAPEIAIKTIAGKPVTLKAGDTLDVKTGKKYQVFEAKPAETAAAKP